MLINVLTCENCINLNGLVIIIYVYYIYSTVIIIIFIRVIYIFLDVIIYDCIYLSNIADNILIADL